MMMSRNKAPHEIAHDSHIHIGHHWYERPVFIGLCFALIVVACFIIGEHTSTKPRVASAAAQSTPEVKKNLKIAAVGDSNTVGTGIDEKDRTALSYPAQLQKKLGSRYVVTNFGVSGTTLLDTTNSPYVFHEKYKESKGSNPDIVLIMLGTNDVRSQTWDQYEYKKQFIALVNEYKNLSSSPKVYLVTPPGLFNDGEIDLRLKNEAVPEVYSVAEEAGVEVIDVFSATREHSDLFLDGVHPNAEGYEIIANTVYKQLMSR
jgi:lysophospholipase L1-like esterase